MEARPVSAELLQADRQTDERIDTTKRIVTFRNFAKEPKKVMGWLVFLSLGRTNPGNNLFITSQKLWLLKEATFLNSLMEKVK